MSNYNPFSLQNKLILVTGASSGIGQGIAIECSKMGAQVILTARDEKRLEETLSQMEGDNHTLIVADISTKEGMESLLSETPTIDGIVHCAGITKSVPFPFLSEETLNEVMGINFFTPTIVTQRLIKTKKIKRNSSIVFISSIAGVYCSSVASAAYSASKGAINGIIKAMAIELAAKKIRVNSVNPGMIQTNIFSEGTITEEQLEEDSKRYPLKRYGTPSEVAHAVIYLLSDASSWTTGSNLIIDGGFTLL